MSKDKHLFKQKTNSEALNLTCYPSFKQALLIYFKHTSFFYKKTINLFAKKRIMAYVCGVIFKQSK